MTFVQLWDGDQWGRSVARTLYPINLADDGTDQTSALLAQLAGVPDGSEGEPVTALLPYSAQGYRIEGTISLVGRSHLILEGRPGQRFAMYAEAPGPGESSTRAHVSISGCDYVAIRHVGIRGPNTERDPDRPDFALHRTSLAFEHGVSISGASDHITVESMSISEVCGDTVYAGGVGALNTNITIRDIVGRHMGRQGLGLVAVDGCLVEDCDLQWGGRSGIDVEPNHDTNYVKNLTLRRVTSGSKSYPFVLGGDAGDQLVHVENVVIEDCVGLNASSSHTALLASRRGTNLTVRRHTDVRQSSTRGMDLGGWSGDVLIEDCVVSSGPSTPTSCGVMLSNCTADVTLRGNQFHRGGTPGASGADELYVVAGDVSPSSITACGNTWNAGASNDGECA